MIAGTGRRGLQQGHLAATPAAIPDPIPADHRAEEDR